MEIYVEGKLPKCCLMCTLECPEEQRCVDGFTRDCENCEVSDRPKTCPLKPLSKKLSEERKKIVSKIKAEIAENFDYDDLIFFLNKIERGEI